MLPFSVSSRGWAAVTSTVRVACPTVKTTGTLVTCPRETVTLEIVTCSKPSTVTDTEYWPGLSSANRKFPDSPVVVVVVLPVSALLRVTVTFGTKAPLGSATVPVTSPEMVVCVRAEDALSSEAIRPNKTREAKYFCFRIPLMVTKFLLSFRKHPTLVTTRSIHVRRSASQNCNLRTTSYRIPFSVVKLGCPYV